MNLIISIIYNIGRNLLGTIQRPYLTWKRIIREPQTISSFVLLLLFSSYFAIRDPVKWGNLKWNGIVIQKISFVKVTAWIHSSLIQIFFGIVSYFFIITLMYCSASIVSKTKTHFIEILKVWIYSYLPTVIWFAMATVLYAIWPPPRSESPLGIIFSALFLSASTALLVWKGLLYYLTMRLALKLRPKEIFWATTIIIPTVLFYARFLYLHRIFNIPFI